MVDEARCFFLFVLSLMEMAQGRKLNWQEAPGKSSCWCWSGIFNLLPKIMQTRNTSLEPVVPRRNEAASPLEVVVTRQAVAA